jgi:hypothetical protein
MTPREIVRALGLSLPVLGILLGIVRAELQLADARRFVLPIAGFDPRDLLHGHYLAYRLLLGEAGDTSICADDAPGCALCLSASTGDAPSGVVRLAAGAGAEHCDGLLPLSALPTLQRYYIPEARAEELTGKLRDAAADGQAYLVIAIDRAGTARAVELWLAGEVVNSAQ